MFSLEMENSTSAGERDKTNYREFCSVEGFGDHFKESSMTVRFFYCWILKCFYYQGSEWVIH